MPALRRILPASATVAALIAATLVAAAPASAVPARPSPLTTPWTGPGAVRHPLPEYPRPQMTRPDWLNLNGEWQLRQSATDDAPQFNTDPARAGQRAVPGRVGAVRRHAGRQRQPPLPVLPPHVHRAGRLGRPPGPAALRRGRLAEHGLGQRRAGRHAQRRLRRVHLRRHRPQLNGGTNELVVKVWDPTDTRQNGSLPPIGKQTKTPSGIFYTPTSGIWQTVWLEPTPGRVDQQRRPLPEPGQQHPAGAGLHPRQRHRAHRARRGAQRRHRGRHRHRRLHRVRRAGAQRPPLVARRPVPLQPAGHAAQRRPARQVDRTMHYFGMREISTGLVNGVLRPRLNGQFVFQIGTLDQGFWPDGVYTAPTDAALAFDLQKHKDLGFNMVRKHIKVEPQRWFYHADRLGLLVWQDIPSLTAQNIDPTNAQQAQFEAEATRDRRRAPQLAGGRSRTSPTTRAGASGRWPTPTGRAEHQEPGPDPAGQPPQWIQLLPVAGQPRQRRHRSTGTSTLGPASPAADRQPGRDARRVRRPRACARPGHEYSPNGNFQAYECQPNVDRAHRPVRRPGRRASRT